jgi:hypothetical protein
MYSIIKQQDELKNAPDNMLQQYMSSPTGLYPQYLVMSEMQRRAKMRNEFSGAEPPKTTMAEEMSGEAPPEAPQGEPPQDPNAQGIMGLPNDTTAGAVMKSRISGQPQVAGNMTASPPQAMADGGPVAAPRANPFASSLQSVPQFGGPIGGGAQSGGLFAGAGPTSYAGATTGTMPIWAQPSTTPVVPTINNQFGAKPRKPQTSNVQTRNTGLNIPKGTAPPKAGTAGLRTTYTGKDGNVPHYSWESAAARDAYVKSLKPAVPAAMADGGPVYMGAGMGVPFVGGPNTSIFEDFQNSEFDSPAMAASMSEEEIRNLLKKPRITNVDYAQNPNYEQEARAYYERELDRKKAQADINQNSSPIFGSLFTPRAEVEERARKRAEAIARRDSINQTVPSQNTSMAPPPAPLSGKDIPGAAKAMSQYVPPAGANAPQLPAPPVKPAPQPAPQSASVSGLPPQPAPTGGGLGDLLKQFEGKGENEDYMAQMRALLDKQRGDPAAQAAEDKNMALMQLGIGMMGSTNRNLFGAISEGAIPALTAYGQSKSERKKDERALTLSEMEALGINAKMSQEERANAQARAIAIDNARREDEAAAFKRDVEFPEIKRSNMATEANSAARVGDAFETREYLADLKTKATIEALPPFRRTSEQKQFLIDFAAREAKRDGGGGGGGMTIPFNAQYDPQTGQRIQ